MHLGSMDTAPSSATFGQDASFRLEQPIGSMSISPSGRDVVLASKEGLHIVDLDSPYSPPRYLPHRTPWEVADVQWSPFAARDSWIVSTSNQKALVWNVATHSDRDAIEFVLHGHSRAITDINFSAHHPELLATCAVDSFVHGWDLRTPSRPSFSFSDWFAGATQVKFNRQDEHLLASSHDRFLHIWDKRNGAYPVKSIEAHGTKICGIDWNRFEGSKIVTCSLDKTIKFWDTKKSSVAPDRVIETGFPIWRARHTPFGWGLLAMPQRDVTDLHLYDRRPIDGTRPTGHVRPVTTFPGHKGQVKEFLWRIQGSVSEVDNRDFQLVTWGADRELRLHHIPEETFHAIGFEKGVTKTQRLNYTRRGARYRTFRDTVPEASSPSDVASRTDSFPSQAQFLGFRNRQSTNIAMSKVPVSQFRGWVHGNRRERRTGMHGKATVRHDMNPITWMKNVKIASWDPDSLADEITQVGEKFQKVEFDAIDITQRKATMSVQGPWGEGGDMVYTRVDLRFPRAYPRAANAIVTIQKSNAFNMEVHQMLATEVRTIAETYASRQRGCIEAVVRYLLSEQTMEQIVSWLLSETSSESKMLENAELAADLSSDSDDENLNDADNALSTAANDRVPLPRTCGAVWSNDGRLVCFFPRDIKASISLLAKRETPLPDDPQSHKLFEAFGRLKTDSPARKATQNTIEISDSSSEASDEASVLSSSHSSSSSSTSSSEAGDGIRDRFASYKNAMSLGLANRTTSEDRSNKSTNLDGTKASNDETLNMISIHDDLGDLIPTKKFLAETYRILGDGKTICENNAQVAEKAELDDIASIWRLASLILEQRVPVEAIQSSTNDEDAVLVVARRSASLLRRQDSGVSLGKKTQIDSDHPTMKGSIRWGRHPFASAYLITAMFNYFERKADIQTLAMLSCVFAQAEGTTLSTLEHVDSRQTTVSYTNEHHYFPSANIALTIASPASSTTRTDGSLRLTNGTSSLGLLNSEKTKTRQWRHNSYQTAAGPKSTRTLTSGRQTAASEVVKSRFTTKENSVGTSPDEPPLGHRSLSNSAFAASRASLSALAQSYSRSPPSNASTAASSYKKPSPSAAQSTTSWTGNIFGRDAASRGKRSTDAPEAFFDDNSRSTLRTSVSSVNIRESRTDSRQTFDTSRGSIRSSIAAQNDGTTTPKLRRKRVVKTKLHNQTQFDIEGYVDTPLIDILSSEKHRTYRALYANLLGVWCLWEPRAQILQFDRFVDISTTALDGKQAVDPVVVDPALALEVIQCCPDCGDAFAPIEKNGMVLGRHCINSRCFLTTNKISRSEVCSICELVIRGLSVPCLQCGHVCCYKCAQSWFGNSVLSVGLHVKSNEALSDDQIMSDDGTLQEPEKSCPTGCGCTCSNLREIDVPWPTVDDVENSRTSVSPVIVLQREVTSSSTISGKSKTELGLDTALGAMMALSSRSRAPSTAAISGNVTSAHDNSHENQLSVDEELMPWASGRFTTLGRGIGGGLSRGLSNRSSDATIRKI